MDWIPDIAYRVQMGVGSRFYIDDSIHGVSFSSSTRSLRLRLRQEFQNRCTAAAEASVHLVILDAPRDRSVRRASKGPAPPRRGIGCLVQTARLISIVRSGGRLLAF